MQKWPSLMPKALPAPCLQPCSTWQCCSCFCAVATYQQGRTRGERCPPRCCSTWAHLPSARVSAGRPGEAANWRGLHCSHCYSHCRRCCRRRPSTTMPPTPPHSWRLRRRGGAGGLHQWQAGRRQRGLLEHQGALLVGLLPPVKRHQLPPLSASLPTPHRSPALPRPAPLATTAGLLPPTAPPAAPTQRAGGRCKRAGHRGSRASRAGQRCINAPAACGQHCAAARCPGGAARQFGCRAACRQQAAGGAVHSAAPDLHAQPQQGGRSERRRSWQALAARCPGGGAGRAGAGVGVCGRPRCHPAVRSV